MQVRIRCQQLLSPGKYMGVSRGTSDGLGDFPGEHSWDRRLHSLNVWPEQTKFSFSPHWGEIKSVACTGIKKTHKGISKTWTSGSDFCEVFYCIYMEEQKGHRGKCWGDLSLAMCSYLERIPKTGDSFS